MNTVYVIGILGAFAIIGIALLAYYLISTPKSWEERLKIECPTKRQARKWAKLASDWPSCAVGEIFEIDDENELKLSMPIRYKGYATIIEEMGIKFSIAIDGMAYWCENKEAHETKAYWVNERRREALQILKNLKGIENELRQASIPHPFLD